MWGQINKSTCMGDNIASQLKNSLFGQIKKIFEQEYINNTYKLPKVIVIGMESSGKISLLERITKCQIFPHDNKIYTKCPIKVKIKNGKPSYSIQLPNREIQKLKNKKDIYPIIQTYMDGLPNEFIYDIEIIINITDNDMPNFNFYDIPEIRISPKSIANRSVNMCKKYLSDKNSIILCATPTCSNKSFIQAIDLIKEANIEHNTILILTMTDRIQKENINELLINRIIDKTYELNGIKFANCIAIVNRSLYESNQEEKKWFDENIYQHISDEKIREQIINNTTLSNLLKNTDILYNNFIKIVWIPQMLSDMRVKENLIKKEIKSLEPIITINNFHEFLSLCLDYKTASLGKNIPQIPTKYFHGMTPIQPYHFFENVTLFIPIELETELIFNIIGDYGSNLYEDSTLLYNKNIINEINGINFRYGYRGGSVYKCIQLYENIFSNFCKKIKIKHVLKNNIFNIPVKRFININKKFDELFLQYIKQRYTENVLETIKRNVIDKFIGLINNNKNINNIVDEINESAIFFNKLIQIMMGLQHEEINDFIVHNLTIDYFVESDENIINLDIELKNIQSNIRELDKINT
jgi:hypothetical protein